MKIGELIMDLGFNADTMKLNDFVKSVGELSMSSIIAGGSLAGLVDLTKNLLEGTAGLARDMRLFGTETGLSEQRMKSWSQAAEQVGIDGKVIENGLRHIREMQSNLAHGKVDMGFQQSLGILNSYGKANISPFESAYTQVLKMQGAWKNLTQDQRMFVVSNMGLNQQWLDILSEGKDFWKDIDKHQTISKADEQVMKELAKTWGELGQQIIISGSQFATTIAPPITEMFREINTALRFLNKGEYVSQFVQATKNLVPTTNHLLAWNSAAANFLGSGINSTIGLITGTKNPVAGPVIHMTNNFHGDPQENAKQVKWTIEQYFKADQGQQPAGGR